MGSVTSNPNVTIQLLADAVVDAFEDRRDIIFGQLGVTGTPTAVSDALNTNVEAMTTAEIKALVGDDGYLLYTILAWKAANGSKSPLDVVAVTAGAGNAATGSITFAGTNPTSAGTYFVSCVDEEQFQVQIDVVVADTPITIAQKIEDAVLLLTDPPFTASNAAVPEAILFTALDTGTAGNHYGLKIEGVVPGITATIASFQTLATGTGVPTITSTLDAIEGIRYTGVVWPEDWSTTALITEFEARFNASNAIMDGMIFQGNTAIYADNLAAAPALNSKVICLTGSPLLALADNKGPAIVRPADWVWAEFAGIRAKRLTPGTAIADNIITTSGGLDAFGGPSLASLPYFNTPLPATPVTAATNLWTSEEQAALEAAGFTTYGVNSAQNAMLMGPVVTTWTTDAGGNPNTSFLYLNYVDTGSACREIFFNVLKSTYAQSRLTEGDLIAGRSMANAESIKAEELRIYRFLATLGLTQAGREAESFFAQNTTVTVSLATRTATSVGPLPIVTQLGTINYALSLSFTIEGTGTQITV
jgi:phage tail sheath gpL-like